MIISEETTVMGKIAVCDRCGEKIRADAWYLLKDLMTDWQRDGKRHYCPKCKEERN